MTSLEPRRNDHVGEQIDEMLITERPHCRLLPIWYELQCPTLEPIALSQKKLTVSTSFRQG